MKVKCKLFGHDWEFVSDKNDPRPREFIQYPGGKQRVKLRKALAKCQRCGETSEPVPE